VDGGASELTDLVTEGRGAKNDMSLQACRVPEETKHTRQSNRTRTVSLFCALWGPRGVVS